MKQLFARFAIYSVLVLSSTRLCAAETSKPAPQLTPAEQKASAILREVDAMMKLRRTMTADFLVLGRGKTRYKGSLWLMKPNFSRVEYRYMLDKTQQFALQVPQGATRWQPTPENLQKAANQYESNRKVTK